MLHCRVNQRPHWACWQYGHSGEYVNFACRIHPAAQSDIKSASTGFHCVWSVVRWLIVYQDGDYLYHGQGFIQKLHGQDFDHFWLPTYLDVDISYPKHGQKAAFFDHLPTSSYPSSSFWTTPNTVKPLMIADRMIPPLGQEYSHGKTQYIPGKQVLMRSRLWKIYLYPSNYCEKDLYIHCHAAAATEHK